VAVTAEGDRAGPSTGAVVVVPTGRRSQVTMPAFATMTAPATHGQSLTCVGDRDVAGFLWTVASVGTFAESWRFCSAFLSASRM
jgi:fructose-1-phosphate kinase PfkB-like protein